MNVKDKIAIVTGGASGLGLATTRMLVARGARVVVFDINDDKGRAIADELGAACSYQNVNVTDEASVQRGVQYTVDHFGGVHILVNCAGSGDAARTVGRNGPYPLDRFKAIIELNLIGTFNVLRLVADRMQYNAPLTEDGERGVIVNVGSVAGMDGQIGQVAYSASKGGVIAMTLPIARDLGKLGIRINTICPGVFNTELMQMVPQEMIDGLVANAQFPPRLGHTDEFAHMAISLMENGYINGEVIRLDAAMRMPPR
ncbi:MAG TPA: SDR family NAD(P)-dependent oxidoreductase [Spongiibacteraceae bacterium]|jgi:NAD(P)-dependent dehydrogenase (short-subunit alcohol dehydrogenase family)|nr:SDR family NAD(P)-dependent oxidoreductase [Spongiibacteraceae bacterium]HUH36933.1 SDR family NAD(P)-dependent oxidoreductase [Spongiibacteraceae bacterium]